jgi:hypothetical protein
MWKRNIQGATPEYRVCPEEVFKGDLAARREKTKYDYQ